MSSAEKPRPRRRKKVLPLAVARRVPVFPLQDVVLFPGALLPLHIFEPRYRKMTADVLDGNRHIAMARLLEPELPDGTLPRFADIVGVGEIVAAERLEDGKWNLILEGRARCVVEEELESDLPYRLIRVREVPDEPSLDPAALAENDATLRALVEVLGRTLPDGGVLLRQVVARAHGPGALSDLLAATLVPNADHRQRLLETTDIDARLAMVEDALTDLVARSPDDQLN